MSEIARYLAALEHRLAGPRERQREILDEVEDHLRSLAEALIANGAAPPEAERRAIARFGTPAESAAGFALAPLGPGDVALRVVLYLCGLMGLGVATIGLSGLIAAPLSVIFGRDFISASASERYALERCADFFRFSPEAADCNAAAVAHHFDEIVTFGAAGMALGAVVALGSALALRRVNRRGGASEPARRGFFVLALVAFGVAALILMPLGIGRAVTDSSVGGGHWLARGLATAATLAAVGWVASGRPGLPRLPLAGGVVRGLATQICLTPYEGGPRS